MSIKVKVPSHRPAWGATYAPVKTIKVLAEVESLGHVCAEVRSKEYERHVSFNELVNRALVEYIGQVIGERAKNRLYRKYFRRIEYDI